MWSADIERTNAYAARLTKALVYHFVMDRIQDAQYSLDSLGGREPVISGMYKHLKLALAALDDFRHDRLTDPTDKVVLEYAVQSIPSSLSTTLTSARLLETLEEMVEGYPLTQYLIKMGIVVTCELCLQAMNQLEPRKVIILNKVCCRFLQRSEIFDFIRKEGMWLEETGIPMPDDEPNEVARIDEYHV